MDAAARSDLLTRLRRIEGQARGLQGMVEDDRPCTEILQQVAAVEAALRQVAIGVTRDHVRHCIAASGDAATRSQTADEVMVALAQLVR